MVISPFVPVIFVLISGDINSAVIFHEVMRMFYCALLIMTVSKLYISFDTLYLGAIIAFLPNFVIQLLEYIKLPGIIPFISQYYVTDESNYAHLELATYSGMEFRSGSVFINPNVYMIIPMLALCVFFYQDRIKPSLINTILIFCAALSGILTGSRTSIIVMAVVMLVYYLKYASGASKTIALVVMLVVAIRYGSYLLTNSRALQLTDTDSFETKYMAFVWYWKRTAFMPIFWITGSLGSSMASNMDSEWGFIYAWYGLFGLNWYKNYYKAIWHNNERIEFFSRIVVITCAMVSMTASVLLCMPVYSFVGVVAFSHLLENEFLETEEYEENY